MGSLDEVSLAIGNLQSSVETIFRQLNNVSNQVTQIADHVSETKDAVNKICDEGCPKGRSNGERISSLEGNLGLYGVNTPSMKKIGAVSIGTSGLLIAIIETITHFLKS
jgi:hypothetical protein